MAVKDESADLSLVSCTETNNALKSLIFQRYCRRSCGLDVITLLGSSPLLSLVESSVPQHDLSAQLPSPAKHKNVQISILRTGLGWNVVICGLW